jgi:hypothetical protein
VFNAHGQYFLASALTGRKADYHIMVELGGRVAS